jgi:hypothetical protein
VKLLGVLPLQLRERERTVVVDPHAFARSQRQHHVAGLVIDAAGQTRMGLQYGILGRFQDAVEAAQYDEGEDYLAVFGLLEVAAQNFCDGPDKGGEGLDVGGIGGDDHALSIGYGSTATERK